MEEKYKILDHRADLKIMAFGKTKEELFLNMLLGMSESQKAEFLSKKTQRRINLESTDIEALLVDFLSEALYQGQVNKEVYKDILFKKLTDTKMEGLLLGQKIERFGEEIKAVTYHSLKIKKKEDGSWEAIVLFDI